MLDEPDDAVVRDRVSPFDPAPTWTPGAAGSREEDPRFQSTGAISKAIAADLRAAQKGGYLPADLAITRASSEYSMGRSIDLTVAGLDRADITHHDQSQGGQVRSDVALEVERRLTAITDVYNRQSNSKHPNFFSHVAFLTPLDVALRGVTRAEKAWRAASRAGDRRLANAAKAAYNEARTQEREARIEEQEYQRWRGEPAAAE